MKECRDYDICTKGNMKLTLTGPVAGLQWIVKLDKDGKRLYMENINMPAGANIDMMKKKAHDMAVGYLEKSISSKRQELLSLEDAFGALTKKLSER